MKFERAVEEDIDQLVNMRMAYLYDDFEKISESQKATIEKELPEYFSRHLGKDMMAFVAKDDGKIIATTLLVVIEKPANPRFITGKIGEVLSVYTNPAYRRQGIAKQLMTMLLAYAKEQKLDLVELKATKDGYPLYKQMGFEEEMGLNVPMKYTI
jgi:GNAT superfamily N-acetyltransferase